MNGAEWGKKNRQPAELEWCTLYDQRYCIIGTTNWQGDDIDDFAPYIF